MPIPIRHEDVFERACVAFLTRGGVSDERARLVCEAAKEHLKDEWKNTRLGSSPYVANETAKYVRERLGFNDIDQELLSDAIKYSAERKAPWDWFKEHSLDLAGLAVSIVTSVIASPLGAATSKAVSLISKIRI